MSMKEIVTKAIIGKSKKCDFNCYNCNTLTFVSWCHSCVTVVLQLV